MVAGNVIGTAGDLVDELPIIAKWRELFHDKVVDQIVWSGDSGPDVQSDPKVAAAFGGAATLTSTDTIVLGTRASVSFIGVGAGGGGGHGRENGGPGGGPTGDRKGVDGTNTKFEFRAGAPDGTLIEAFNLAGGEGGASCSISYSSNSNKYIEGAGENVVSSDSNYGTVGTGGLPRESSSGTDATGIGAGGGGGRGLPART